MFCFRQSHEEWLGTSSLFALSSLFSGCGGNAKTQGIRTVVLPQSPLPRPRPRTFAPQILEIQKGLLVSTPHSNTCRVILSHSFFGLPLCFAVIFLHCLLLFLLAEFFPHFTSFHFCSLFFLCVFLYLAFSPLSLSASTCSRVHWRTVNPIRGTPPSPPQPLSCHTTWRQSISGAVRLCIAPPQPIPDTRQCPVLQQRPQLGDRQSSVVIRWRIASYQVCKASERRQGPSGQWFGGSWEVGSGSEV